VWRPKVWSSGRVSKASRLTPRACRKTGPRRQQGSPTLGLAPVTGPKIDAVASSVNWTLRWSAASIVFHHQREHAPAKTRGPPARAPLGDQLAQGGPAAGPAQPHSCRVRDPPGPTTRRSVLMASPDAIAASAPPHTGSGMRVERERARRSMVWIAS